MDHAASPNMREFRPADVLPVQRVIHDTIDACYAGHYPPRAVAYFKDYHSEENILERHRDGDVLVVEQEGEIVATGARLGEEIMGVFVLQGFQGRGYGEVLVRELETRVRAGGYGICILNVSLPSRGFYEKLGYQIGKERSADVGEGQHLDYWLGAKPLGGRDTAAWNDRPRNGSSPAA